MTAVIPFSVARFTPADVRMFLDIAETRIDRGMWDSVMRETDADGDRFLVIFYDLEYPGFVFQRDRSGAYEVWFCDGEDWCVISTGSTSAECLAVWDHAVTFTKSKDPVGYNSTSFTYGDF